jgi:hypothetical protein
MNDNTKTKIDPSLTWNVKLGLGALREHLDGIMSAGDDYRHKLVMECIWMAEKISADAEAAHENADEAATAQR